MLELKDNCTTFLPDLSDVVSMQSYTASRNYVDIFCLELIFDLRAGPHTVTLNYSDWTTREEDYKRVKMGCVEIK